MRRGTLSGDLGMKVLIVEDDSAMRHFFTEVVRGLGCEVCACADAETAWQMCQQETYPLLLLDWLLPPHSALRWYRFGAGDFVAIGAYDERTDLGRKRGGRRQHILFFYRFRAGDVPGGRSVDGAKK